MIRVVRNAVLAIALSAAALCASAETLRGLAIHVSDGDTVTVLINGHDSIRVRLSGIDAPESRQPFGTRSRQLMSRLVKGRDVVVHVVDRDTYGRYVARLETEDADAGEKMLEAGLAWAYVNYLRNLPRDWQILYQHAEGVARTQNRGLWSDPHRIPPWEWRQMNRSNRGW